MEVVKFHVNTTAALAVIAFCLGAIQLIGPLPGMSRIKPAAFIFVGALFGLRYAVQRESKKREEILKSVPRRPLGLDE
jgi:hypothetical protein